jgi:hypothetical protein
MDGGNKYAAAVASVGTDTVRVIIKETFQHPNQVGKLSFPAGKAGDVVRPYTRESVLRSSDSDDDEETTDEVEDWDDSDSDEETTEAPRDVSLFDASAEEDTDDNDYDE